METPSYVEIQRRHVEESKKWPDLRAYAAEVLRRHEAEAKKASKARTGSASQREPAPRNFPLQEDRRKIATGPALEEDGKSTRRDNLLSNKTACQQSEGIALQENTVGHAIETNGVAQSIPASSHMPGSTVRAVEDSNLWATGENDGQGMDEASFQKLLAAIQNGIPVLPKLNAASTIPGSKTVSLPTHPNCHRKGIANPDSRFADSRFNGWEKPENRAFSINAIRAKPRISFREAPTGSNLTAANGRSTIQRKEKNSAVRIGKESPIKFSNGMSCGVSKKRKPKRNLGPKKADVTGHPYACRKTDAGCLLCFASRSPECPHGKTVARDAFQISRNKAIAAVTPSAAITTEDTVSGQDSSPFLSLQIGTSFNQNMGSRLPGVSKNGRIQKASSSKRDRGRRESSAVAARQWNAQELAQLCAAALNSSSSQATAMYAPEKSVGARSGIIPQSDSVQPARCNAPEVDIDLVDISSSFIPEIEKSIPSGPSHAESDLFEGMLASFPDHLALPMLDDLPTPGEFFQ